MRHTGQRNLLFVGTGNLGRSVMAEAYLNSAAGGRWRAHSAGSHPTGHVHPLALATLAQAGIEASVDSKSWDQFLHPDAQPIDVVIVICATAGEQIDPAWPGAPRLLHWPIPDPATVSGSLEDRQETFAAVFEIIRAKIDAFLVEEAAAVAA